MIPSDCQAIESQKGERQKVAATSDHQEKQEQEHKQKQDERQDA